MYSCQEEMPDLQATWEEFAARGVGFVGIAYRDELGAVEEETWLMAPTAIRRDGCGRKDRGPVQDRRGARDVHRGPRGAHCPRAHWAGPADGVRMELDALLGTTGD